jgi:hypothetical protein
MELRNRFHGTNSASLCSLAGRYDNPIPTRLLAPIACLKIPAQLCGHLGQVPKWGTTHRLTQLTNAVQWRVKLRVGQSPASLCSASWLQGQLWPPVLVGSRVTYGNRVDTHKIYHLGVHYALQRKIQPHSPGPSMSLKASLVCQNFDVSHSSSLQYLMCSIYSFYCSTL